MSIIPLERPTTPSLDVAQHDCDLRGRLVRALTSGDRRIQRLAVAKTTVKFEVIGAPQQSARLLLDRNPPTVEDGHEAEVTFFLTIEQAQLMTCGKLNLPVATFSGEVGFEGPARKYLCVDVVLRGILAAVAASERAGRLRAAYGGRASLDVDSDQS